MGVLSGVSFYKVIGACYFNPLAVFLQKFSLEISPKIFLKKFFWEYYFLEVFRKRFSKSSRTVYSCVLLFSIFPSSMSCSSNVPTEKFPKEVANTISI